VERKSITQIIVSTVVPRALHNLEVLARNYFGVEPLIAGEAPVDYAIDIDVDEPRSLGADRAVNAIAAHAKYPGDLIIIDFGTATTLDVIDFNGAYKGGIIAPGINLSLDALVGNTAKLPRIAIEVPKSDSVIGRNTEDQMLIGVYWGYVAMMEGLIARMRAEIGRPAKVIATGGLAVLFDEATDIFDAVDADLTLDGLAILAERAAIT
jgi:type III pantothenate kinase